MKRTHSYTAYPTPSKKRFLLLEVLIALCLVEWVAVPLLLRPLQAHRAELSYLEEIEGERLADLTFCEIKELLFLHRIPWQNLPKEGETCAPFPLSPIPFSPCAGVSRSMERSYTLSCALGGQKNGVNGEVIRLLRVAIHLTPRPSKQSPPAYTRTLVVMQKNA